MATQIFIYVHPNLGKWSSLTDIFQMGWNHQLVMLFKYECIVMDLHQIIVKWIYTLFKLRIGIHVDYVGLIWIFSDTVTRKICKIWIYGLYWFIWRVCGVQNTVLSPFIILPGIFSWNCYSPTKTICNNVTSKHVPLETKNHNLNISET